MKRLLCVLLLAVFGCGCVTAPLVDFGDRDKPFVNIQVDGEDEGK